MDNPLIILPCLSTQLELYSDHVTIRPMGAWAWVAHIVEQTIPISHITSVRLIKSTPRSTGVIEMIQREARPKSVYVLYSHRHAHEAQAMYETLDDLVTRRDVLSVMRSMESE